MWAISNRSLRELSRRHPEAGLPLQGWRKLMEHGGPRSFAELRRLSNSVDRVGDYYVFDIAGNRFRLIAAVHFDRQMLLIRHVFTHAEYTKWNDRGRR